MGEISSFVAHGAPVYNCIYVWNIAAGSKINVKPCNL